MTLTLPNTTWRIILQATYSTAAAATTAETAFNNAVSGYSGSVSPRSGRFSAGLNKPNSTTITISYETNDETVAKNLAAALLTSGTTNRTAMISAMYRGNTP